MNIEKIPPQRAHELLVGGARLIDIRSADEHRYEAVQPSANLPLGSFTRLPPDCAGQTVVFYCQSGQRTAHNQAALSRAAQDCAQAFLLDGGIDAWKAAGLPTAKNAAAPLPLMRQVQIAAGALVLAGVLLGTWAAPAFYALAGFVGAGLLLAGITGFCGMARLLAKMPWNRV